MQKLCAVDGREFTAKRAAAKYCSDRCRKRAQRGSGAKVLTLTPPAVVVDSRSDDLSDANGPMTAVTRLELSRAGRLDTANGQLAMLLARRLDGIGAADTGSGVAALVKEHRVTLAEAVKDANVEQDPMDVIRESAALKLVNG